MLLSMRSSLDRDILGEGAVVLDLQSEASTPWTGGHSSLGARTRNAGGGVGGVAGRLGVEETVMAKDTAFGSTIGLYAMQVCVWVWVWVWVWVSACVCTCGCGCVCACVCMCA
jgi:hypothetical protein